MAEHIESICRSCFHSYVCEQFNEHRDSNNRKCHFFNDHFISAADVAPMVHGRWIRNNIDRPAFVLCNKCNICYYNEYKYCPNCGAKMDQGGDAE